MPVPGVGEGLLLRMKMGMTKRRRIVEQAEPDTSSTYASRTLTLNSGPMKSKKKNERLKNLNSFSVLESLGDDVE